MPVENLFHILPASHPEFAVLKKKQSTQQCVFLAEDKKCLIHRTLGEYAKPGMCSTYPRLSIQDVQGESLASYQSPSCYSVARERPQRLQLCYTWHTHASRSPARFTLSAQKQMDQSAFFLWTGFGLDVFEQSEPLSTTLSRLLNALQSLAAENTEFVRGDVLFTPLQKMLLSHERPTSKPLSLLEYQSLCLALSRLLSPFEAFSDFGQWLQESDPGGLAQALSAPEHAQMCAYQRNYFAKQILTQEYVRGAYINILQQLYLWCKLAFLQTTLSLFIRETGVHSREYMGKATNLLHALVIQSPSNLKQWQLHRWPDPMCYLNLYRLIRGLQILGF